MNCGDFGTFTWALKLLSILHRTDDFSFLPEYEVVEVLVLVDVLVVVLGEVLDLVTG